MKESYKSYLRCMSFFLLAALLTGLMGFVGDLAIDYGFTRIEIGVKNVTIDEDFFKGHFPDYPVMPGVIIIEAMAQMGGILVMSKLEDPQNYLTFFAKIDKVRFRNKVLPGDTIIFKCSLIGPFRRGICHMQGLAYANGKLCAEAELTAQITKVK